ncbi:hypothetical protein UlMin_003678 [Ulmus minor]
MDEAVREVEEIIGYNFNNKKLLEEALSHPSIQNAPSYERLEFFGDAALGLAVSKHIYLNNPELNQGELTNLRSANVSTERLARVALRRRLYDHVRRNCPDLDQQIKEFAEAVSKEDETDALHGGSVKAPKGLADIVESIAAAVYVDTNFDLQKLWLIFRVLLEPLVTYEDLQPQPVTMLFDLCQKQGKKVRIEESRDGSESLASVYVDEEIVSSFSSQQKETARLNAAKLALLKLQEMPTTNKLPQIIDGLNITDEIDGSCEIEAAQEKLNVLCDKMKWSRPDFKEVKKEGPPHKPIYVYSVQIQNGDVSNEGDEKSNVRDAKNSAASYMIRALQESNSL